MTARAWSTLAFATVLAWVAIMAVARRTDAITDDWQGWRQADTAAIARNFIEGDPNPLRPQIDWGGAGPGYVEAEFQLYTTLTAIVGVFTGDVVPAGQAVSLACVVLACVLLWRALVARFGPRPAYLGLLAALSMQGTIVASTTIQPDPLAFLAFTVGWLAFLDDLAQPTRRAQVTWIVATAIAGLVKPTALELGLAQFTLVALAHRAALRRPRLWLGWAIVLAIVGAHLLYARTLYTTYGNTFGVLSGGDSKLPTLATFASFAAWKELARYSVVWGVGFLAPLAALYLAATRRFACEELALGFAAVVLGVFAFRYTATDFGTHYHLPHVVLGAWLVAHAALHLPPRVAVAVVAAAALLVGARGLAFARHRPVAPETILGRELARLVVGPDRRVVVRARAESYNREWRTVNNYQDPRVLWLARAKGWVIPNDAPGSAAVADAAAGGAAFYVHVAQYPIDAELAAWLAAHAHRVATGRAGEIYQLRELSFR